MGFRRGTSGGRAMRQQSVGCGSQKLSMGALLCLALLDTSCTKMASIGLGSCALHCQTTHPSRASLHQQFGMHAHHSLVFKLSSLSVSSSSGRKANMWPK